MGAKINWNATPQERHLIEQIAARAQKIYEAVAQKKVDLTTLEMDVAACHLNGCPLNLEELLKADAYSFMYDITGINKHINRETGQLEKFLPLLTQYKKSGKENDGKI